MQQHHGLCGCLRTGCHEADQCVRQTGSLRILHFDPLIQRQFLRGLHHCGLERGALIGGEFSLHVQGPAVVVPSHPQVPEVGVEVCLLSLASLPPTAFSPELRRRHGRGSSRPGRIVLRDDEPSQRLQLIKAEIAACMRVADGRQLLQRSRDTNQLGRRSSRHLKAAGEPCGHRRRAVGLPFPRLVERDDLVEPSSELGAHHCVTPLDRSFEHAITLQPGTDKYGPPPAVLSLFLR